MSIKITGGGGLALSRHGGVRLAGGGGGSPYDAIPSIAAAYGMRRLRGAYTGSLLRLRRGSDNAEANFGYTAAGDLDTAAIATWLGAASGYVTTWYDQSGNGKNAVQTTAGSQPSFVSQAGGLSFNGTSHVLPTGVTPVTGYSAVVRFGGATGDGFHQVLATAAGGDRFYLRPRHSGASRIYGYGNGTKTISGALTAGIMALAGASCYLDGAPDGDTAGVFMVATSQIYIGAEATINFFAGAVHEVVLSSATYTASQIAAIVAIMEAE